MRELLGRTVHHVMQSPDLGEDEVEYAAIISRIERYNEHEAVVRLHIFAGNTMIVKEHVRYSAERLPETWHWMEGCYLG